MSGVYFLIQHFQVYHFAWKGEFHIFVVLEYQILDTCSPDLKYDCNMICKIEMHTVLWKGKVP